MCQLETGTGGMDNYDFNATPTLAYGADSLYLRYPFFFIYFLIFFFSLYFFSTLFVIRQDCLSSVFSYFSLFLLLVLERDGFAYWDEWR
jgi:hypothetical protein